MAKSYTDYANYEGLEFKNKWNETFKVKQVKSVAKILVKFDSYDELITATSIKTLKNGTELKTPRTRSVYNLGFLDYKKEEGLLLKISKKERDMWNSIIKRWSKGNTIENERYCSLKNFIMDLRELPRYNALVSTTGRLVLGFDENGTLKIKRVKTKRACKRVHASGRTATYISVEECANALGVEPRTIIRHIESGEPLRNYTFKWIEK